MRFKVLFAASTFLLILMLSACIHAQQPQYSKEVQDKIKQVESNLSGWVQLEGRTDNNWLLEDRMKYYKVRGLSIAVVHNYKLDWAMAYGIADSAKQIPVTTQTLFQAGSISKSLNGVGVLKLVQDKKLDLSRDINEFLRSWKFPYDSISKGKKINVANLLSHTAGLTIHGFPGYENGDTIPTLQQILDGSPPANTKAVRSAFEPGLKYQYSGGGTTISQVIVQDLTGQPYDVYMWNEVFKPMGMTMSSYTQPPATDKRKFLATGYRTNGKEVETKYHVYPEQAAAGLWTNPTDLSNYIIETQLALGGKSNKVLSQEMTKLRLTPYIDSSAALGVFVTKKGNDKYFGHNGADEGFLSAYMGSFENGNGVVVMVNCDNGRILNEVINSVAKVYGWKDYYKPSVKKTITIPDSLFDRYAGNYLIDDDTVNLSRKAKQLMLTVNNDEPYEMFFTSPDEFLTREIQLEFKFSKDTSGKITDFFFRQGPNVVRLKRL